MCNHNQQNPDDLSAGGAAGRSRRSFLQTSGLAGIGATALAAGGATPAFAAASATSGLASGDPAARQRGRWRPDTESRQFTMAVMPDTQFLFFGDSIKPEPLQASFQYILDNANAEGDNIVFMAHLGDLTENGTAAEFAHMDQVFGMLDRGGAAYSVVAGNHDVGGDDQRGSTPYLQTLGPKRFKKSPSFRAATPDGYNTYHVFRAAGREWLLLAMDWRPSAAGFAWANKVIKDHPHMPVILTTHEIANANYTDDVYPEDYGNADDDAVLSDFGHKMWDELIKDNDQIFLTLNGHYWPPARTTMKNTADNDVHVHITNYQNRYYGGAAMIRLYHFDLDRNTIDVETMAPWILDQKSGERNVLAGQMARLTSPVDYFSVAIDFEQRFSGFIPVPVRAARPAQRMITPGTLAYWRFDQGGKPGSAFASGQRIPDLSGHGNDLTTLVTVPGSASNALVWSGDHHPDQPGHGSLLFSGGKNPLHGAYLTTGDKAPLNSETFQQGYTFEAFVKVPTTWSSDDNSWMALLSRWGEAGQAGKSTGNTDPDEPIVTFSLSSGREPQWCVYPTNLTEGSTNWGHALPEDAWWHLAVVNDGRRTVMYVEGCETVDNPSTVAIGLTTLNLPWLLGGYEYGGSIDQIFHGWIGDVRIVNRPLKVSEFMIGK
ncbi:LamG-like jellyroll fold domain-containing protein [Streptomyces sp. MMS24-I2-30]|uniref:LamG-like jellyroll fold domain-containing protein n=1 Tax=Streptomyces sp. MMS24-I2-30 TaxID=3351564 RepID=UPI003896E0D9